jgi:hypothetical protein
MKNRQHSRILTTVVLVAAMSFALGAEAFAAGSARSERSLPGFKLAKPSPGPMAGEPDAGGGTLPPPPKVNPALSAGGRLDLTGWMLRYHWSLRILLLQLPKRFP